MHERVTRGAPRKHGLSGLNWIGHFLRERLRNLGIHCGLIGILTVTGRALPVACPTSHPLGIVTGFRKVLTCGLGEVRAPPLVCPSNDFSWCRDNSHRSDDERGHSADWPENVALSGEIRYWWLLSEKFYKLLKFSCVQTDKAHPYLICLHLLSCR